MICKIQGNFVQCEKGEKKDGTKYMRTTILSGADAVNIWGYDPGDNVKKFAPIEVLAEVTRGEKGLFVKPISPEAL